MHNYIMGIKTFFRNLGRSIKRGFNNFVAGAGDVVGGAATVLQRKIIPGIASGATKAAGLLDKAAPAADAAGVGPEAAEASQVLGKVGNVVGKFADFIGSNAKQGRVATPDEINRLRASIPQGKTLFGIKPLPPPPAAAPAQSPLGKAVAAGAFKPLIGSNPASYSPSSGIEAPPVNQPKLAVIGGPSGMSRIVM